MTSKQIPTAKEKMLPPGTHLNNLLNNLFILQKEGSRLSQENLRADLSLLESPLNPETSVTLIEEPSELLPQWQSCPLYIGYKDPHLWVVVRIGIICVR